MLKTVKNGSGIRVDPLPCFFLQNSHIFPFFFGQRPLFGVSFFWLFRIGSFLADSPPGFLGLVAHLDCHYPDF